jgi:hypothetical protein
MSLADEEVTSLTASAGFDVNDGNRATVDELVAAGGATAISVESIEVDPPATDCPASTDWS